MYVIATSVGIEKGIHARPSARVVEYVLGQEDIRAWIEYPEGNTTARADSVVELLMLGAPYGKTVVVKAEGKHEKEVALYIADILKNFHI